MAGRSLGDPRRILEALFSRPDNRRYRRRRDDVGFSFRPNAPTMLTVVAAVALTLVGLSLSGEVTIGFVNDFVADRGWTITRDQAYMALIASPLLLIAGSFLRGL